MRYAEKWPEYAKQWDSMTINSARTTEFTRDAQRILAHKEQYLEIEKLTADDAAGKRGEGVPWHLIAVNHLRESNLDFGTYLGNGQSLIRVTTIVPKGRGPFFGADAFKRGALDALNIDGLSAVFDWRLEKELYYNEIFNGAGYHMHGLPSAYVWGGTNIQRRGKYVSDNHWDATVMDTQPGTAPILWMLAKLDPTIKFVRESASDTASPTPVAPPASIPIVPTEPIVEKPKGPPKAGPRTHVGDSDFDPGIFRD